MYYDRAAARRRRAGIVATSGLSYAAYIASLAPVLWYKFDETSGTTVTNYGSFGSNQNGVWTVGSGALGQTGKLGANNAYDFNASKVAITQTATNIGNLATYTHAMLIKLDAPSGTLWEQSTLGGIPYLGLSGFYALLANEWAGSVPNSASNISAANFLTVSTWTWLFRTFDNAGDRKNHIYKGVGGAVTEATYGTDTAMAAARSALGTQNTIGNQSGGGAGIDGLIDEALMFSGVLTTAQMLAITQSTGV